MGLINFDPIRLLNGKDHTSSAKHSIVVIIFFHGSVKKITWHLLMQKVVKVILSLMFPKWKYCEVDEIYGCILNLMKFLLNKIKCVYVRGVHCSLKKSNRSVLYLVISSNLFSKSDVHLNHLKLKTHLYLEKFEAHFCSCFWGISLWIRSSRYKQASIQYPSLSIEESLISFIRRSFGLDALATIQRKQNSQKYNLRTGKSLQDLIL